MTKEELQQELENFVGYKVKAKFMDKTKAVGVLEKTTTKNVYLITFDNGCCYPFEFEELLKIKVIDGRWH